MTRWAGLAFSLVVLAPSCKHVERHEVEAHAEAAIRWDEAVFTSEEIQRGPVERVTVVEEWAGAEHDKPPGEQPNSPVGERPDTASGGALRRGAPPILARRVTTTVRTGPVVETRSTAREIDAEASAQLDQEVSDFEEHDTGPGLAFWGWVFGIVSVAGIGLAVYRRVHG